MPLSLLAQDSGVAFQVTIQTTPTCHHHQLIHVILGRLGPIPCGLFSSWFSDLEGVQLVALQMTQGIMALT